MSHPKLDLVLAQVAGQSPLLVFTGLAIRQPFGADKAKLFRNFISRPRAKCSSFCMLLFKSYKVFVSGSLTRRLYYMEQSMLHVSCLVMSLGDEQ